jgi:hypothetical protein
MTIECNGVAGVISWSAVIAIVWFALCLPLPKIGPRLLWKTVVVLCAGYIVFFYAFR